jgi:hypothetical protein
MRLVAQDIRIILADFRLLVDGGHWPRTIEHFLPDNAWVAHRATLARELDDQLWSDLSSLMATIPLMRTYAGDRLNQQLPADEVESYREGIEHYSYVYEQLTGKPPISGRQ